MTLASKITLSRVILIPVIIALLFSFHIPYNRVMVVFLFIVASLTDVVDGYFARRYKQVTSLGKFLDPLADKLLIISILVCMVELQLVQSIPVILIITREFTVTGLRLIAAGEGHIIDASVWGKVKTVSQVIAVVAIFIGKELGGVYITMSQYIFWLAVLLTIYSGIDYFIKNRKVFQHD